MPLRRLTARERSSRSNWQLAAVLAFVAGAADVSGYLALHQFTSHMSGIVASLATTLAERKLQSGAEALTIPAATLSAFLAGAAVCAVLVNWARRRNRESLYAVPVLLEALLLAALTFPAVHTRFFLVLVGLCFSMGLQNAIITKISESEIRTTHVTGMITDIGIELGKVLYINRSHTQPRVRADGSRLALLSLLVALFFGGGALGAFAYLHIGFLLMLPLAAALASLTVLPIMADLQRSAS
jgi:uncharacterized membrane protein YoaK (UPF0700 family)